MDNGFDEDFDNEECAGDETSETLEVHRAHRGYSPNRDGGDKQMSLGFGD